MPPQIEIAGYSLVLLGSLNPAIFQPLWFSKYELLREEERVLAEENLEVVHPEFTGFDADWLAVRVTRDRCVFSTTQSARHTELRDIFVGTFSLLSHTPVQALGLNRDVHYRMASREEWDAVGHRMAPKEPWAPLLRNPGLRSIKMEERRADGEPEGYLRVELAPSIRVLPFGTYVQVNDHYQLASPPASVDAATVIPLVQERWDAFRERAEELAARILASS